MIIRRMREQDAQAVSELIITTIRISNTGDYPADLMEELVKTQTPEHVLERASWTHFYVAEEAGTIIGCGAIGPYWGKEDESSLFSFFIHPDHQRKGIGRAVMAALEQDEFALRAKRIEIPASVTGLPFYQKMGYTFKNGNTELDEEHLYRLEKHVIPQRQQHILNAILHRHSYRGKYKPEKVPREHLKAIMEAGLAAPSGCNKQTTSLIAVDDPALLARLQAVIDPPVCETAPAMICVLTQRINAYRDRCFATQDYAAAIENMLLAITALGYQSCWYEGHITDADRIGDQMARILNVPDEYELVCVLPVGTAESEPVGPKKKPFEDRAFFNGFESQPESYQIRQVTTDDYDAIMDLWSGAEQSRRALNPVDDSREGIGRYLKRNPGTCLAAVHGDRIIGVILTGHDGRRGLIHHLCVHPDFRRMGIAARLVSEAEKALKKEGIQKVFGLVFTDNEAANAFWEKQGYSLRTNLNYRNKSLNDQIPTGE